MRLVTVRDGGQTSVARLEGDQAVRLPAPGAADVGQLLAGDDWRSQGAQPGEAMGAAADLDLAPVIPRPPKIICIGLNYRSHILEAGMALPTFPVMFAKYTRALIGPRDPICLAAASTQVDWEVELGVVVGRAVRHADRDEAREAIAGYTVVNDVSMRDWQARTPQFLQGKTFEGSTPIGPALVTPDEVDDARDLRLWCEVDGEVMQDSRTSDLLFGPAELVSYISTIMTLDPGDLIATGTPGGVGWARQPQRFLKAGETVRCAVEGIGEVVNTCVPEEEWAARSGLQGAGQARR